MSFLAAAFTDIGIRKDTNQDSILIKVAQTPGGSICLAVVCDGMGGLDKGELASATVVRAFDVWFENAMPERTGDLNFAAIKSQWIDLVHEQNNKIRQYGMQSGVTLGTTLSAVLLFRGEYFLLHIGDSRIYKIKDPKGLGESADDLEILTQDQTVATRDIGRGILDPSEAASDPRRHILLQCVGASTVLKPQLSEGLFDRNDFFMLCTDGLYNRISSEEIYFGLHPSSLENENEMLQESIQLVDLCKMRQETDNITIILIKAE